MHETFYGQSLINGSTVAEASLNRAAPEAKVDFVFPPIERVFERKTFLGDKLKHVIEPRITYDYVTGVNDFLGTLRFDPTDLLTDTNQVEFGLTNRIYAKKGDTVTEILTWELIYERYFNPTFGGAVVAGQRNVLQPDIDLTGFSFLDGPRNYSPIVSIMRITPRNGVNVRWQADYDPKFHRFTNSMLSTDFRIRHYFASVASNVSRPNTAIARSSGSASGQSADSAGGVRRPEPQRLEYGSLDSLRFQAGLSTVCRRAGHIQHGLLRLEFRVPAERFRYVERHAVPRCILNRKHRNVRQSEEAGTHILTQRTCLATDAATM